MNIINEVANSKEYLNLCKKIANGSELYRDLFQELIIILIEYDQEKIKGMHERGELKFFIVRILQNQFRSNSSDFYKKHVKFNANSSEITGVERQIEDIESSTHYKAIVEYEVTKENFSTSHEWYENNLFKSYLKEGSLRKLEKETGISRTAITNVINKYTSKLKAKTEAMKKFIEPKFIRLELPENLKADIFINSLYEDMKPEELLILQLKKINRTMKTVNKVRDNKSQMDIFLKK